MLPSGAGGPQGKPAPDYVSGSRKLVSLSEQCPKVLRYYSKLILPIVLAAGAIVARIVRMIFRRQKTEVRSQNRREHFVLLLAVWWILDMAFVWISPHSYEQYYLPLNASAAMLGGYLVAIYCDKIKSAVYKTKWVVVGLIGFLLMIIMSWHIFFGIETSPDTGRSYGGKARGYLQKFREISSNPVYTWETVGEYIRAHSQPSDKIYVWGWVPGIYVKAQRFSPAAVAFCSTMHVKTPEQLAQMVTGLLAEFQEEPPKFFVDTHNIHFPYDGRPPLELWPIWQQQILKKEKAQAADPDEAYADWLAKNVDADEAGRFRAMKPFRQYVMSKYKIVRSFDQFIVFERIS